MSVSIEHSPLRAQPIMVKIPDWQAFERRLLCNNDEKYQEQRGSCEIPGGFVSQGAGLAVRDASQAGSCHSETIRSS